MPFLETNHQRAGVLVLLLGVGLAIALAPFATGLISIPVLYVILHPIHDKLSKRISIRVSAAVVVTLGLLLIVVPGVVFVVLLINQAQVLAGGLQGSPLLEQLGSLRIGGFALGPYLADLGSRAVTWLGGSALGLIGTATRQALNLLIALFGLYYLLLKPHDVWRVAAGWVPFSEAATERLSKRFRDVTASTIIGSGLAALIQGSLAGLSFWIVGIPNVLFWSMVTMVLAILPVVGSGLVWGPAALSLFLSARPGAGLFVLLWGALAVSNVDFFIRPMVFRRWAHIHPVTTLVGALAGVPYFGILGLLIGPLALSYFFELLVLYREEYGRSDEQPAGRAA